jgi:enediyne biosynthesis protein E5
MLPANLLKDARYFQIIFQGIFLCYGIIALHWSNQGIYYALYIVSCIAAQTCCEYFLGNKKITFVQRMQFGFPSVLITILGLCLLLKTNHFGIAILAAVIAITSKYLLRFKGKHIFNPSALGIAVAVYGTGQAWISPGQWGNNAVLLFAVFSFGFIVLTRIQKLDVSLFFLAGFGGLMFARQVLYLGWPMDFFVQTMSTGSLLLFSFFMITDPKTMPNHFIARRLWALTIGISAFYLASFQFNATAPILVLVLAQPLVPLIDYAFAAERFEWITKQKKLCKDFPAPV